jgi:membrane protease YdiL (CAAX protease family)
MAGVFLALVLGAILTGFYLWKRNLLAVIVAHFMVDFIPNILFPLLSGSD